MRTKLQRDFTPVAQERAVWRSIQGGVGMGCSVTGWYGAVWRGGRRGEDAGRRILLQGKARQGELWQKEGRTVCFVDDGINDSIALSELALELFRTGFPG